jgi:hypothetical protein
MKNEKKNVNSAEYKSDGTEKPAEKTETAEKLQLKQTKELLSNCTLRKNKITNLDKIGSKDYFYREFLSIYEDIEITPDIQLFGYEKAIKGNQYLSKEYPFMADKLDLWQIGVSGQGDCWFLDRTSQKVLFYEHGDGEFNEQSEFVNLDVDFEYLFRAGFLFRDVEDLLYNENVDIKELEKETKQLLIDVFINNYPFDYFCL